MFAIPNQSSVPMAYTQFTDPDGPEGGSRMLASGNRDRLVDCMEEFVKYTVVMREHFDLFGDRYSERVERRAKAARAEEQEKLERLRLDAKNEDSTKTDEKDVVNKVDIKKI